MAVARKDSKVALLIADVSKDIWAATSSCEAAARCVVARSAARARLRVRAPRKIRSNASRVWATVSALECACRSSSVACVSASEEAYRSRVSAGLVSYPFAHSCGRSLVEGERAEGDHEGACG